MKDSEVDNEQYEENISSISNNMGGTTNFKHLCKSLANAFRDTVVRIFNELKEIITSFISKVQENNRNKMKLN